MNPTDKPAENTQSGMASPLSTPTPVSAPPAETATASVTPATATPPPAATANVIQASSSGGSAKKWVVISGVIVLIVLLGVGALYFRNMMQESTETTVSKSAPTPVPSATGAESELSNIESSFSTTALEEVESDFTQVDRDIDSL